MRGGVAIMVAGVAVAGAVYFASLHLDKVRHSYQACPNNGKICLKYVTHSYWVLRRADWQIPIAIVIAALGIGAAAAVARS